MCDVTIAHAEKRGQTAITVSGDGSGLSNIEDPYTLMRSSEKRSDPTKRNIGETEIVAASLEATVETVGYTVRLPRKFNSNEWEKSNLGNIKQQKKG